MFVCTVSLKGPWPIKLEPDGTEVELVSTFRVIVLWTAKMELAHNNN